MGNDREITLIIKADGTAAIKTLGQVQQATGGLVGPTDKATASQKQFNTEVGKTPSLVDSASNQAVKGANKVERATKEAAEAKKQESKAWLAWSTDVNQALEIAQKALSAAKTMYNFAKEGAELAEARDQFRQYANSAGRSADQIIEAAKRATGGQVSNAEIISATMAAMRQNVTRDQGQIGKLWEIAEAKSDQFGGTITENFQKITEAITTGNARSLLSLGLLPASFGRATDATALLEKRGDILRDVFAQFSEDTNRAAQAGDSTADSINKLEANFKDLGDNLKTSLVPYIASTVEGMTSLIKETPQILQGLAGWRDHVAALAAAYATAKLISVIDDVIILSKTLDLATKAQNALNVAMSANPYHLAAIGIAAITAEILSCQAETNNWKQYTENQSKALSDLAEQGSRSAQQEVLNQKKVQIAMLQTQAATLRSRLVTQPIQQMEDVAPSMTRAGAPKTVVSQESGTQFGQLTAVEKELAKVEKEFESLQAHFAKGAAGGLFQFQFQAGKKAANEFAGSLRDIPPHFDKATKAAKAHKEAYDSLESAIKKAFEASEEFSKATPLQQFGVNLENVGKSAVTLADALGMSRMGPVKDLLVEVASAAGFLAGNLEKAADAANKRIRENVTGFANYVKEDVIGERYSGYLSDVASEAFKTKSVAETMFGDIEKFVTTFYGALSKPDEKNKKALEQLETPLSKVFNDAFVQGLEGGNFFDALGKGLKRVVIESFSNQITSALFGQSGAITSLTNQGSSGGSGLLGGILKPIYHSKEAGGGLNWAGIGTNLAVAAAASFLTSPGRLLGGTVTHGGEVPGQASDINSQVLQALKDRENVLATAMGLSKETTKALQELTFASASWSSSKSGDGIFSKKTNTYTLDASAAQASLAEWSKVKAQAEAEVLARQFEIALVTLKNPAEALTMTIKDLQDAVARLSEYDHSEAAENVRLQLAQAQKQSQAVQIGRAGGFFDLLVGSGFGSENMGMAPGFFDDVAAEYLAKSKAVSFGKTSSAYTPLQQELTDRQIFQQTLTSEGKGSFDVQSQLAAGKNLWDVDVTTAQWDPSQGAASTPKAASMKYGEFLKHRMDEMLALMQNAEKAAMEFDDADVRALAWQNWQSANSKYWEIRGEALDLDTQKAQYDAAHNADLVSKIEAIQAAKGQLSTTVGLSDATFNAMNATGGALATTYAGQAVLNGASEGSLSNWIGLAEKMTAKEVSKRNLDIGLMDLKDPMGALEMSISDLKVAINRGNSLQEDTNQLQLQLAQLEKQKIDEERKNKLYYLSFSIENAGFVNPNALLSLPETVGRASSNVVPQTYSSAALVAPGLATRPRTPNAHEPMHPTATLTPFQPHNSVETMDMVPGEGVPPSDLINTQIDTWTAQQQFNFNVNSAVAGGKNSWEIEGYEEMMQKRITDLKKIMDETEKQARDATLTTEARQQWMATYQTATNAYFASQLEVIQNDAAEAAAVTEKKNQRKEDLLYSLMVAAGETREMNGSKVIVINAQNPDKLAWLKEIRDGLDAEGKKVIDQIITNSGGNARWS